MSNKIESFEKLVNSFSKLPGVGKKTAQRFVYSIIDMEKRDVEIFASNLNEVKQNVKFCNICGNWTDQETCNICKT
ncbi:MAG: recombination protein RecR, partial [Candidatus Woesearchaeota archaeon]